LACPLPEFKAIKLFDFSDVIFVMGHDENL
jgi:hypothetical protein